MVLTQDQVLDQFELILLLVFQHPLEVFLPARNVDWMNRLFHHLTWRRLTLGLTRCQRTKDRTSDDTLDSSSRTHKHEQSASFTTHLSNLLGIKLQLLLQLADGSVLLLQLLH